MEGETKASKRAKSIRGASIIQKTLRRRTEEYRMRYVENITQNFVVYGV